MPGKFSWITKVILCLLYKHPHVLSFTAVLSQFCPPAVSCFKAIWSQILQVNKSKVFLPLLISTCVSLTWKLSRPCKKKDGMWFNYSTALITYLGTVTINCTVQFINLRWSWIKKNESVLVKIGSMCFFFSRWSLAVLQSPQSANASLRRKSLRLQVFAAVKKRQR